MKKDTNESFDLKNSTKYKRVGEYINCRTKILFMCPDCLNNWEVLPANILKGSGCPYCSSVAKDTNESFDLKNTTKYERVGEYINSKTKISFHCPDCLNNWEVVPNSILKGHGCPSCATTGFDYTKLAYLYFIQIEDFLKVGITNRDPKSRYKGITRDPVIEIKVIEGLGKDIYELEQSIHKTFEHYNPKGLKSGNTECFAVELKEQISDFLGEEPLGTIKNTYRHLRN